jgi:hypothetical protein
LLDLDQEQEQPPVIEPFAFRSRTKTNQSAGTVCHVSQGSLPLEFDWIKDEDSELPSDVEVISSQDASILSIEYVTSDHIGSYTCLVKNKDGSANYTAELKPESKSANVITT